MRGLVSLLGLVATVSSGFRIRTSSPVSSNQVKLVNSTIGAPDANRTNSLVESKVSVRQALQAAVEAANSTSKPENAVTQDEGTNHLSSALPGNTSDIGASSNSTDLDIVSLHQNATKISAGKIFLAVGILAVIVGAVQWFFSQSKHELVNVNDDVLDAIKSFCSWLSGFLLFFLPTILRQGSSSSRSVSTLSPRFEFVLLNDVDDSDVKALHKFLETSLPKPNSSSSSWSTIFHQSPKTQDQEVVKRARAFVISFDTESSETDKQRFRYLQEVSDFFLAAFIIIDFHR